MRRGCLTFLTITAVCGLFCYPAVSAVLLYDVADLGSDRFEYTYELTNDSLPTAIEEFTIWFDFDLYENLAVTTPAPPAGDWDEIVVQPEPILSDDGYYDALTLNSGIGVGETLGGFSVSFDWLGVDTPGWQYYEIIDPDTFEMIEDGYTVPEPATLILLGTGMLALRIRRRIF